MKKAGKQIDKFSQWTGERLFKEEKTQLSSAFREVEQEMDLRTRGAERLVTASQTYFKAASRRDKLEDAELAASNGKEKVLPVEALGLVMIHFGEGMGRGSEYGEALVNLGRAQCKVAAVQDRFLEDLSSSYLDGLERNLAGLKDYQAARKKLDSRRLAMDAAAKRLTTSKKQDRGLEEEVRVSRARFEEMQEDVELRAEVVRGAEGESIHDLSGFLDAHLTYIEQYRDILLDVKKDWSASFSAGRPRALSQPRPAFRSSTYDSPDPSPDSSRPGSSSGTNSRARSNSAKSEKGSSGGGIFSSLRMKTPKSKKWGALEETSLGGHSAHAEEDEEGDEDEPVRRPGARGPASPALGARTRSTGAMSTLSSFDDNGQRSLPPPSGLPRRNTAPLSPNNPDERVVKARYDFSSSAPDELSLKIGDVIVVTSEVSDDWFQGKNESTGVRGIFPSAYTEPYQRPPTIAAPPPLPTSRRPSSTGGPPSSSAPISRSASSYGLQPPPPPRRQPSNTSTQSFLTDSEPEEQSPNPGYSSADEEDDKAGLTHRARPPAPGRFGSAFGGSGGGNKKGPAPPPPASRRLTVSSSTNQLAGAERTSYGGRPSSKSVGAGEDSERNPFFG